MSRVSDALLRAAGQGKRPQETPPGVDEAQAESPFESAWDLERLRAEAVLAGEPPAGDPSSRSRSGAPEAALAALAAADRGTSSIRLESQLAMGWPQPFDAEVSERLVVMRGTDPTAVAQYRRLAAALDQARQQRAVKSVMIASGAAGEGRTLTAVNLALMLSEVSRARVLLVDADLRQPKVHDLFRVSMGAGLAGFLGATDDRLPIVEVTPRLALLPAGRTKAEPGVILGSDRMRAALANASSSFDWVILDTPAALPQPDAGLLAPLVDTAILVIEADKTPQATIQLAVDALGRDRLLGVVLNRASAKAVAAAGAA